MDLIHNLYNHEWEHFRLFLVKKLFSQFLLLTYKTVLISFFFVGRDAAVFMSLKLPVNKVF